MNNQLFTAVDFVFTLVTNRASGHKSCLHSEGYRYCRDSGHDIGLGMIFEFRKIRVISDRKEIENWHEDDVAR